MSDPNKASVLLTPLRLGPLTLPNRFVRSATQDYMATDAGEVTDRQVGLYRTLAEGEVGLIITGHAYIHPLGKAGPNQTRRPRRPVRPRARPHRRSRPRPLLQGLRPARPRRAADEDEIRRGNARIAFRRSRPGFEGHPKGNDARRDRDPDRGFRPGRASGQERGLRRRPDPRRPRLSSQLLPLSPHEPQDGRMGRDSREPGPRRRRDPPRDQGRGGTRFPGDGQAQHHGFPGRRADPRRRRRGRPDPRSRRARRHRGERRHGRSRERARSGRASGPRRTRATSSRTPRPSRGLCIYPSRDSAGSGPWPPPKGSWPRGGWISSR